MIVSTKMDEVPKVATFVKIETQGVVYHIEPDGMFRGGIRVRMVSERMECMAAVGDASNTMRLAPIKR